MPTASERSRASRLRSIFDMSVEDYDALLLYQGGVCAICGRPPKTIRLAVDHDHKTGEVRGLLCGSCNRGLAERITAVWLTNAHSYMEHPPVLPALHRIPQGRVGRVTRKRRRTKARNK